MQIKIDTICKEFDIRAEEIFAFMDEEKIHLGGSLMHDIAIDLPDFRKFVEYWRRQLKLNIQRAERELDGLDSKVDSFIHSVKGW
jgi:uncharacterized protein Usg